MAYLDLDDIFAARGAGRLSAAATLPAETSAPAAFSPLEWSVVALAKHDTLRSLEQPGRLSRALRSLFGLGATSPLADPRLEALRRLAVYAWNRGFALPLAEIDRFLAAGFVEAQIEALVVSVTGMRVAGR